LSQAARIAKQAAIVTMRYFNGPTHKLLDMPAATMPYSVAGASVTRGIRWKLYMTGFQFFCFPG
jgi:hypothetical protein